MQTDNNALLTADETEIYNTAISGDYHAAQRMEKATAGAENIGWTGSGSNTAWAASAIAYALAAGGGGISIPVAMNHYKQMRR